jgi:ATP-binding cassette, subfamily B, bacterial
MIKKSFPFIQQLNFMDCGPTCLHMICRHYGQYINIEKLRQLTEIGKEGVNLLGISNAAEKIDFRTMAVQIPTNILITDAHKPCILHWQQNHFVVLYKTKRNKFYIADPAKGLIKFSKKEFEEKWLSNKENEPTGIALLLEPTPAFYNNEDDAESKKASFKNILQYLQPYKKLVAQLLIGLLLGSLLQLIFPFLTQSIVDVGVNTGNLPFVYIILFAQLALFAGRISVEFIRNWILYHISSRINIAILTDFLIKLMKLPMSYFDSKKTGDIMQRMNDHQRIQSFLTSTSLNTLFSALFFLLCWPCITL